MEVGDEVCVSHDLSDFRIDLVLLLFYERSFIHVFLTTTPDTVVVAVVVTDAVIKRFIATNWFA